MADTTTGKSSQTLPNQVVTPTAIGLIINAALSCKQTVNIPKNTTMNELYGVLADESVGRKNGSDFVLGYFGVGIGGSRTTGTDSNGLEGRRVYQHKATDFGAFHPIPMLMRELSEDIDPLVRENYRIRVIKKIGDVTYVQYWLKKIGFGEFDPTMKTGERNTSNGNQDEHEYTPVKADMSPTPYELTSTNSIPVTNTYVNGTGKLDFSLSGSDLEELRNVCRILYGDSSKAAINEIYTAYGIESSNNGQIENGTVSYNELQSACVGFHITEAYARDANSNSSLPNYFWYGNSLPLLVTGSTTE